MLIFHNAACYIPALLILLSCNKRQEAVKAYPSDSPVVAVPHQAPLDTTMFVVLRVEQAGNKFKNSKPASLSNDEIRVIEKLVERSIVDYKRVLTKELEAEGNHTSYPITFYINNFYDYQRQLVPFVNANGEKVVWVNCFCNNGRYNWRKEVVEGKNGGNCYFNVKINLAKQNWYDMEVNG